MKRFFKAVITFLIFTPFAATAQKKDSTTLQKAIKMAKVKNDSAYIDDLSHLLTLRVFGSRDYITYKLADRNYSNKVVYEPNIPYAAGIGASYKFIGFNIAVKTPLVKSNDEFGKTSSFNLSSHIYLPKFIVDVYGSYYKGYYITQSDALFSSLRTPPYYLRPDLRSTLIGLNVEYVLNAKKFSYLGTFSQLQYQKKSAGSFIFGGGIYTQLLRGDSAIVPEKLVYSNFFNQNTFNHSSIYSFVVNGGYAYTLVIKRHYFISGSLNFGVGVDYTELANTLADEKRGSIEPQLNTDYRIAGGYNSDKYFISFQYVNLLNKSFTPINDTRQDFGTGNYRLIFAKRFRLKRHNMIERTMNRAVGG